MKSLDVTNELALLADPVRAEGAQRYFKTGVGEYGEGDIFIGITTPLAHTVAKKYAALPRTEIQKLLASPIHEHRAVGLKILVLQYARESEDERKKIVAFYLAQKKHINNWDLVDASAPYILGDWLIRNERSILDTLIHSKHLWDRRIAMISTLMLIRHGEYGDTLHLAETLLTDTHDLMHKAAGWMLREVGKKSEKTLITFLNKHASRMPRTMLRYALERLPKESQKKYLGVKKQNP
jgi:3-methyladenine DNA glycosylase AlkD